MTQGQVAFSADERHYVCLHRDGFVWLSCRTPENDTGWHDHDVSSGPEHIHRLTGRSAGAVSVHAYSPPLWRMCQYA